jgi:hypothetical protein
MHDDDIPINSLLKGGDEEPPPSLSGNSMGPGGRRDLIGPLKKGELVSKGYNATRKTSSRRRALAKAVRAYGRLSTLRKLNAVAVLTKRRAPARSKTFKKDRNWVKKTYF